MILKINKNEIDTNLIIFDSVSLQAWGGEDGKMIINIPVDSIKRIVVETNE